MTKPGRGAMRGEQMQSQDPPPGCVIEGKQSEAIANIGSAVCSVSDRYIIHYDVLLHGQVEFGSWVKLHNGHIVRQSIQEKPTNFLQKRQVIVLILH